MRCAAQPELTTSIDIARPPDSMSASRPSSPLDARTALCASATNENPSIPGHVNVHEQHPERQTLPLRSLDRPRAPRLPLLAIVRHHPTDAEQLPRGCARFALVVVDDERTPALRAAPTPTSHVRAPTGAAADADADCKAERAARGRARSQLDRPAHHLDGSGPEMRAPARCRRTCV